ncbi:FapA family protein [candidate division KSB1 bacterium]
MDENQIIPEKAELERKPDVEFQDIPLEKMDVSKVQDVLTRHFKEESEETETGTSGDSIDDKLIVLEVRTLDEGLEKAALLFGVDKMEIEYNKLDKAVREIDGEKVQLNKIEFKKKITSGETQIVIAEDGLSAEIRILFPKKPDGTNTTLMDIIKEVRALDIQYGVKTDIIKAAIEESQKKYRILEHIVFAKGDAPSLGEGSQITESVFEGTEQIIHEKSIKEILLNHEIEEIEENNYPVYFVNKGDLIVVTSLPDEGKEGKNIFGEELSPEMGKKMFNAGENVKMEFDLEKIKYTAEISGYLEMVNSNLNVISPIFISKDELNAYYLKLPYLNRDPVSPEKDSFIELLSSAGIVEGVDNDILAEIPEFIQDKHPDYHAFQIAGGIPTEDGEDARIEYFFSSDAVGDIDGTQGNADGGSHETVKAKQLLAVKFFPTEGKTGMTIKGKKLDPIKGVDKPFKAFSNIDVVKAEDKITYYSKIEGRVDLVGDQGISVNKNYIIDGDVDQKTGNLVFDGNVHVKGSVLQGLSVSADGNIVVEGSVNQNASLTSKGSIRVKEGIVGKEDVVIKAKGNVKTKFLQGAIVQSEGDIIVQEYIINTIIKTFGFVFTPGEDEESQGRGSIMNSDIFALKGISALTIGSDTSTSTKVTAGWDFSFESKMKDLQKALKYCEFEIAKISKTLRLGNNSIESIKALLKKLPPQKQKPLIELFKKLNTMNALRAQVMAKVQVLQESTEGLAGEAVIKVKNSLFSNVLVHIGEKKLKTEKSVENVTLKLAADGEKIKINKSE